MKRVYLDLFDLVDNHSLSVGSYFLIKGGSVPQRVVSIYRSFHSYYVVFVNAYGCYHIVMCSCKKPVFVRTITNGDFVHFLTTHNSSEFVDLYFSRSFDF